MAHAMSPVEANCLKCGTFYVKSHSQMKFCSNICRLMSRVKMGRCWEFLGAKNNRGYGIITVDGRQRLTHRFMYEQVNGEISDSLFVCHSCDNPSCCNPDHLFLGTAKENTDDMWQKGRQQNYKNMDRGSSRKSAALDEYDVINIRVMLSRNYRQSEIADLYSISRSVVNRIHRGQSWTHV